jgi:hypothetical protein
MITWIFHKSLISSPLHFYKSTYRLYLGLKKKEAVPRLLVPLSNLPAPACSDQVFLRHPETSIYRCFLSNLTDFIAFCRAGPSLQHHLTQAVLLIKDLQPEINPAKADCRYRAPLVPHLAQPQSHAIVYPFLCQGRFTGHFEAVSSNFPAIFTHTLTYYLFLRYY